MSQKLNGLGLDTFRSLGVRNFRLFFVGQPISQVGNWMTMIALALLVLAPVLPEAGGPLLS